MAQTGSSRVQGEGRPCKNAVGFCGGFVAFLLVRFRLGRLGFEGFSGLGLAAYSLRDFHRGSDGSRA